MMDELAETTPLHPASRRGGGRGWRRWLTAALLIAIVLAGAYIGVEAGGSTTPALANICGQLSFTRRGLPCDIPLPSDATFIGSESGAYAPGVPMTTWTFSTSLPDSQLANLYTQGAGAWWTCESGANDIASDIVGGDNPNRPNMTLDIVIFSPLNGASKLRISLIQSASVFWLSCNGA